MLITDLHRLGLFVMAIARQIGMDRKTVRNSHHPPAGATCLLITTLQVARR